MEKRFQNTFFVEKHMNKLPIWKIILPGQIPSWKESATIKLKHFFAKNCQNKEKLTQKLSLQTNGRQLKHEILQKVCHYHAVSDGKRKK